MVLFDIKITGLSPKNKGVFTYNINISFGCLGQTLIYSLNPDFKRVASDRILTAV
jgi:hypothetical protein